MKTRVIFCVLVIILLNSCKKDNDSESVIKKESISGLVQKGPFISGTSVLINELSNDLAQTGKTYSTQIANNQGSFELQNIELISNYISLSANGFYFNEIFGKQSASQITLRAISDISDQSTVNVNILSHLEKARVEYLYSQGVSFSDAKLQAQNEVLKIFSFNMEDYQPFEFLDISKDGENNAVLLAVSLILQGFRSEGDLTELLSNISSDIREDGVLDNMFLGSQLINHAMYLNTNLIRANLEKRYSNIGVETIIPNFEKYLQRFKDSTKYEITDYLIEYPENGLYGQNILDLNNTNYSGSEFSLTANLHKGTMLKVKITSLETGIWYYAVPTNNNWSISDFDFNTKSQYFIAIDSDRSCDLKMKFDAGEFLVEYFEMGATEPNRTKTILR